MTHSHLSNILKSKYNLCFGRHTTQAFFQKIIFSKKITTISKNIFKEYTKPDKDVWFYNYTIYAAYIRLRNDYFLQFPPIHPQCIAT